MAKQLPVTEFDILTLPGYLQLFKALIPFMEYGMQKKLSMLIRANELKHTLSFYNSPYSCNTFKTCSNSSGINANTSLNDILNNEAIMKTILAYCPDNIEQLINTYRNFSNNASSNEFNNNNSNDNSEFNNFNNNTGSGEFNNISINNILNSSQKDMYNEYIKQLDKLDFNDGNNYGSSNNN